MLLFGIRAIDLFKSDTLFVFFYSVLRICCFFHQKLILTIYFSIYSFIYYFSYLFTYLFIYLFIYLFVYLLLIFSFIHSFIYLVNYLVIDWSIFFFLSSLFFYLFICLLTYFIPKEKLETIHSSFNNWKNPNFIEASMTTLITCCQITFIFSKLDVMI